ncbi:MAG: hypothetical protein RJB65_1530 [Actinomycetota bacterium]
MAAAKDDGSVEVEAAGRAVRISSPGKVFFAARGETKLDLVRYYLAVEEQVMRQMRDRPVMMQRFPDGASGKSFFQKRVPDFAPDWLTSIDVRTVNGTTSRALVIADIAHLVWAVNLGCIGFHAWPVRAPRVDEVDELRIDLDPGPGTDWRMVLDAAAVVREFLAAHGTTAFVKTSGSRGVHVYVRPQPGYDGFEVRRAAVAIARELERQNPRLLTASWWKEERGARIFIDFNQNAPHKTVFAAWSARAFEHAPVSFPVAWDRLASLDPRAMTIASVPADVAEHGDAWASIDEVRHSLAPYLAMADADDAAGLPDAPWPPEYPKMAGEATRVSPSRARTPRPED